MPHRILIVDDDPILLGMLDNYLGKTLKYEVATAQDGNAALELAMKRSFDLCIIDVHMPGLSGSETYMRLKASCPTSRRSSLPPISSLKTGWISCVSPAPRTRLTKPITDLSQMTRLIIGILGPPAA